MPTWSLETTNLTGPFEFRWFPDLNEFCALNFSTNFQKSPDGLTWTGFPGATDQNFAGIASNGTGTLVAVSIDVNTLNVGFNHSTDDGETWTLDEVPSFVWPGPVTSFLFTAFVFYAASLGVFVIVGATFDDLSQSHIKTFTSADGVSWTETDDFISYQGPVGTPAWSDSLGRAVLATVVADGQIEIYTSEDMATWTLQTVPANTYSDFITAVRWSEGLGLFFTTFIDEDLSGVTFFFNDLLTSPDGITWSHSVMPTVNNVIRDAESYEWINVIPIEPVSGTPFLLAVGLDFNDPAPETAEFMAFSLDGFTWELFSPGVAGFSTFSMGAGATAHSPQLNVFLQGLSGFDMLVGADISDLGPGGLSITLVDPDVGDVAGSTEVEITGTGFDPDIEVLFDQLPALSIVWNSSTSLTVTTPPHAAGFVDITVTNPDDGEFVTETNAFEYVEADSPLGTPTLDCDSIDPPNGTMLGGTTVTILGSGLVVGSEVFFGDSLATDVVVDPSGTFLTCVTPAHPVDTVDISVITPNLG